MRQEKSWVLTDRQLCDCEMIMDGSFSPLDHFMTESDYDSVLTDMRLSDGNLFPLPIVLDVDEEFAEQQRLKQKLKTQLELVKECKRVPRINPPPPAFAELINMCIQIGVMSSDSFGGRDFDPKISYWTELKEKYMKENPDIITLDNYKEKK